MVDVLTCAIFRDCRLRGVGVVRGINLPYPIDFQHWSHYRVIALDVTDNDERKFGLVDSCVLLPLCKVSKHIPVSVSEGLGLVSVSSQIQNQSSRSGLGLKAMKSRSRAPKSYLHLH